MPEQEKQPLVKLELSIDLQEINNAGIPLRDLVSKSDKIAEKINDLLKFIYFDLTVVDVSKSPNSITKASKWTLPDSQTLNAVFRGYAY